MKKFAQLKKLAFTGVFCFFFFSCKEEYLSKKDKSFKNSIEYVNSNENKPFYDKSLLRSIILCIKEEHEKNEMTIKSCKKILNSTKQSNNKDQIKLITSLQKEIRELQQKANESIGSLEIQTPKGIESILDKEFFFFNLKNLFKEKNEIIKAVKNVRQATKIVYEYMYKVLEIAAHNGLFYKKLAYPLNKGIKPTKSYIDEYLEKVDNVIKKNEDKLKKAAFNVEKIFDLSKKYRYISHSLKSIFKHTFKEATNPIDALSKEEKAQLAAYRQELEALGFFREDMFFIKSIVEKAIEEMKKDQVFYKEQKPKFEALEKKGTQISTQAEPSLLEIEEYRRWTAFLYEEYEKESPENRAQRYQNQLAAEAINLLLSLNEEKSSVINDSIIHLADINRVKEKRGEIEHALLDIIEKIANTFRNNETLKIEIQKFVQNTKLNRENMNIWYGKFDSFSQEKYDVKDLLELKQEIEKEIPAIKSLIAQYENIIKKEKEREKPIAEAINLLLSLNEEKSSVINDSIIHLADNSRVKEKRGEIEYLILETAEKAQNTFRENKILNQIIEEFLKKARITRDDMKNWYGKLISPSEKKYGIDKLTDLKQEIKKETPEIKDLIAQYRTIVKEEEKK